MKLERLNDLIQEGIDIDFSVDGLVTTITSIERWEDEYLVKYRHPRTGKDETEHFSTEARFYLHLYRSND